MNWKLWCEAFIYVYVDNQFFNIEILGLRTHADVHLNMIIGHGSQLNFPIFLYCNKICVVKKIENKNIIICRNTTGGWKINNYWWARTSIMWDMPTLWKFSCEGHLDVEHLILKLVIRFLLNWKGRCWNWKSV